MTTSSEEPTASANPAAAPRQHASLGLLMLGVVAGTCLVLVGLAHSEPVGVWIRDTSWEQNRSTCGLPLFCFTHHFTDFEDWFLHEEIPSADFSRPGVYILGASHMKWALKPWAFPEETRPFIHNFSFGGVKHSDQLDFLHYLVDEQGFLKTNPEKTLVVFGMSYRLVHHGRLHRGEGPNEYFRQLWTRHGFYSVDPGGTIHRTPRNPLVEKFILEQTKMTGLLREVGNIIYTCFRGKRVQSPEWYNAEWTAAMESNWNEMMDSELDYLRSAFEYLKEHKAKAAVVLAPVASWDAKLPFQAAYNEKLRKLCAAEGVPIYDDSKAVNDEDFSDSDHLNPIGVEKFQPLVMGICLDHLRSAGILPEAETSKRP